MSFVVFSDDWGVHLSSAQHLFRRVALHHSVVWINTIGMRNPALTPADFRKAYQKVTRMFRGSSTGHMTDPSPEITVRQPFMLPFGGVKAVRAFNARQVSRVVSHERRRAVSGASRVIVSTVPNAGDYCAAFSDARVVYYCVDDFSQWPGLNARLIRDMEARLIDRADLLVATSERVRDRLAGSGKTTRLLTHGVDVEHFTRPVTDVHPCLAGIPAPRAGFFGLIDERTDQSLMSAVAQQMPDLSFVLAGPIDVSVGTLSRHRNVHFVGAIPYGELPSMVAGLDALIIPYAVGCFADTLSLLKIKEYLVTGKPVISTPIADARAWEPYVAVASTSAEWVAKLRSLITTGVMARPRDMVELMRSESWEAKAETLLAWCAGGEQTCGSSRGDQLHAPTEGRS